MYRVESSLLIQTPLSFCRLPQEEKLSCLICLTYFDVLRGLFTALALKVFDRVEGPTCAIFMPVLRTRQVPATIRNSALF